VSAKLRVRDAVEADLPALTAIHNAAVRTTTAIWDEEEVTEDERLAWWRTRTAVGHPVLVAEVDGAVCGYASYGQWRPKSGYRLTVENSLYVDAAVHRRGIGRALLAALVDRARAQGLHRMIGMIESENLPSIALHQREGFRIVGHMPEVGQKFGRWLGLTVLQLDLDRTVRE
jgi:phosphinothricin acetyltransferase